MTAAGASRSGGASIGSVLTQLRPEFPDVTISKIRFLESEGLVSPDRTSSGYRQFSPADVQRLRYVLAAQRDHYLPLKVIKEQLEAMDRGTGPGGPTRPRLLAGVTDAPTRVDDFSTTDSVRITKEELLEEAGITAAALTELEQFGVIKPGVAGFYDADALLLARTARAMTEFGLEARHLRAFRAAADREVGMLEQIVSPVNRGRDPDARQRADEVARELAVLSVRLHTLLVKTGLRGVLGA